MLYKDLNLNATFRYRLLGHANRQGRQKSMALDTLTVKVNGSDITFKVDTGAEVTAISETAFKKLNCQEQLQPPLKTLMGPSQQPLPVKGQLKAQIRCKDRSTTQPIYVVSNLKNNLLGLPALTDLQIVSQIDAVED